MKSEATLKNANDKNVCGEGCLEKSQFDLRVSLSLTLEIEKLLSGDNRSQNFSSTQARQGKLVRKRTSQSISVTAKGRARK